MRVLRTVLSRAGRRDAERCWCSCRAYSTAKQPAPTTIEAGGRSFRRDEWSNATPTILSKVPLALYDKPDHPIGILRGMIQSHFASFEHLSPESAVVTVKQNFDDLGFPADHPGRSKTDSYYLNEEWMLRTHTSAHEVQHFKQGKEKWLLTADVYRRDEIDRSHYPVFHQMEGANVLPKQDLGIMARENEEMERQLRQSNIQIEDPTRETTETNPIQPDHTPEEARIISDHLKNSLNGMVLKLFGGTTKNAPLKVRWIEATFPWTQPSYEVEVFFEGKWLEILGCGVVRQETLRRSDVPHKMGWAFGLGLERIAMVLFSIPDIRLFWSQDERFLSQFKRGQITKFKPYSKYPECYKDFSFWLPDAQQVIAGVGAQGGATETSATPDAWHENDFMENVRDVAGDLVENVEQIDNFVHPKTKRRSVCYRINYRSMDRSLSNDEVNDLQEKVKARVVEKMRVEPR